MKSQKPRKTKGVPDSVDKFVGQRLKSRRILLGMSQEKLAESAGITFQQVQKYERGTNRISSSRLLKFSKVLQVPIGFFFEGSDEILLQDAPAKKGFAENDQESFGDSLPADVFTRKESLILLRSYYAITEPEMRKMLLKMVKSMAANQVEKK